MDLALSSDQHHMETFSVPFTFVEKSEKLMIVSTAQGRNRILEQVPGESPLPYLGLSSGTQGEQSGVGQGNNSVCSCFYENPRAKTEMVQ